MIENRIRQIFNLGDYRRFLLNMLPSNSIGCELGVWKGDFSKEILDVVQPATLYLIDPWMFQPEFADSWYGGTAARSQKDMDDIHDAVAARFSGRSEVRIIRKKTEELTDEIPDFSLDWVYVDGNHQYDFVLSDLRTFLPKVKQGGVICGDDYSRGKGRPITRAVQDFIGKEECELLLVRKHQFVIRKGRDA